MRDAEDKEKYLEALDDENGRIGKACSLAGIPVSTLKYWRRNDPEFERRFRDVRDLARLCQYEDIQDAADAGDPKCKIYVHEHDEEALIADSPNPAPLPVPAGETEVPDRIAETAAGLLRKVENKKRYLVRVLKGEGKYTAELSMQVTLVAQMLVRVDALASEIFSDDHSPVSVELSREGNERESISPKERLYLDYVAQAQRSLKALGMNTDSKERRTDGGDPLGDLMKTFAEEGQ